MEDKGEFKAPPALRYYEHALPAVGDVVKCKYQSLTDTSAYVALLEYGNIEAMVTFSELARGRVQSIAQLASVGREETLMVLRVDPQKKYIDLSKKGVTPKEVADCEVKFKKSRTVVEIMWQTAEQTGTSMEMLMENVAWPLYKQFGHAYEALERAEADPQGVLGQFGLPEPAYNKIVEIVKRKLKPRMLKLEAQVNVVCMSSRGVEAIKEALHAGEDAVVGKTLPVPAAAAAAAASSLAPRPLPPVQVTVIGPPVFLLRTQTTDRDAGLAALRVCVAAISDALSTRGGTLTVEVDPREVGGPA
jgi:translation initiation factor 2 subunit 1